MDQYDIKRIYEREGRNEAFKAYPKALEDNRDQDSKLNGLAFLAADFAHPEALRLLFEAGISPAVTDEYGFTLLHYLARQEASKYVSKPIGAVAETTALLLDNKVSAIRKDENERMVSYHYAARNGLAEMVEIMVSHGTKLDMTDKEGNTGIHIACEYVRYAIRGIDIKKKELESAERNYKEKREHFIKLAESSGNNKKPDLEEDFKKYVQNNMIDTPENAKKSYEGVLQKVEDYFQVVKAFVEGGVDKDDKNGYGQSALDIATESGAKKIAAYLSGAMTDESDLSAIAAGGMTLHKAAENGDLEAIDAICKKGADVNGLKDGDVYSFGGCTPLTLAIVYLQADAVEKLLVWGADPGFRDGNGRTALYYLFSPYFRGVFDEKRIKKIVKDMVNAGMSIDLPVDDEADTLLILACRSPKGTGYKNHSLKGDVIDETLRHNPNINLANCFGETALMQACSGDFDIMENVQISLLEQGADVAAADRNGDTALHYAARNTDKPAAKSLCDMLLEFGANANAVNNLKKTALDIAAEQNNEPLVKLLLSKM